MVPDDLRNGEGQKIAAGDTAVLTAPGSVAAAVDSASAVVAAVAGPSTIVVVAAAVRGLDRCRRCC